MFRLILFEAKKTFCSTKNILVFIIMLLLFVGTNISQVLVNIDNPTYYVVMDYKIKLENESTRLSEKENVKVNDMLHQCKVKGKMTDEFLNWDINHCQNIIRGIKETNTPLYVNAMNRITLDRYYISENGQAIDTTVSGKGIFSLTSTNRSLTWFFVFFFILIAADAFNKEYKDGMYKILLTQPFSRNKIVLSKYISTVVFSIVVFTLTLLINYIISTIAFGFVPFDYPMQLTDNFLSLSLFSQTKYCTLCPAYLIFILSYLMNICIIFAITAICLFLSTFIKHKSISILIPTIFCLYFCNRYHALMRENSIISIFSYCNTSTLLDGTVYANQIHNTLTYLDGVIISVCYIIIFLLLSVITAKAKQFSE